MGRTYEIIVERNQNIKECINQFVLEKDWENAYISGAIGSIYDVELTTPISMEFPPKVEVFKCEGPAEVLTFTGEIMKREKMDPALKGVYTNEDEPLFIHIHASVAIAGSKVYGGGFQKGKTFRKLKVYIQEIN